jgi:hypothetical protein
VTRSLTHWLTGLAGLYWQSAEWLGDSLADLSWFSPPPPPGTNFNKRDPPASVIRGPLETRHADHFTRAKARWNPKKTRADSIVNSWRSVVYETLFHRDFGLLRGSCDGATIWSIGIKPRRLRGMPSKSACR